MGRGSKSVQDGRFPSHWRMALLTLLAMTHPFFFTWQAQQGAKPIEITGGEGAYFDTPEGRILDLGGLIYQMNAGHGERRIIDAVKAQADKLCVSVPSAVYEEKTALAEALLAKAPPGFDRVFFCLGGSDANEHALKIARLMTGRYKVVSRYRSYHGSSMGAVSMTGDWRRTAVEPGLVGAVHVTDLDADAGDLPHGTAIPRTLALEENVAAVFLEPIVGANGVLIPPEGYFPAVREACDAHGALLVADEVLVGFGRTGKFFALEHFGVTPDLITCGKALTAGYGVLGAVLVHERVSRHFEANTLATGLTHYAHPLGVAAALAAMRVYDEDKLTERAANMEGPLRAMLAGLTAPCVRGHRVKGLLAGIDLDLNAAQLNELRAALWRRGLHVHVKGEKQLRAPGGALVLSPPLNIRQEELAKGLEGIQDALMEVSG